MLSNYKILFEVKFLHHYLLNLGSQHYEGMSAAEKLMQLAQYNVEDIFEISPTETTRLRANGSRFLFKKTNTGFFIGTASDSADDSKAKFDFIEREKFSFNIYFKDSALLNFSALPIRNSQNKIYHFDNLNKSTFQFPNLTELPAEFDGTTASALDSDGDPTTFAYQPGDLIIDDQTDPAALYEAIQSTNQNTSIVSDWRQDQPGLLYDASASYSTGDTVRFESAGKEALYTALLDVSGVNPTNTGSWQKQTDLPLYYVNEQNKLPVLGPFYDYDFGGVGEDRTFDILDSFDNIIKTVSVVSTEDQLTYQLDLRSLKSGKFTMRITDNDGPTVLEEFDFYLQRKSVLKPLFGVIDIYSGDDLGEYSLVNSLNEFQSPEFLLRFKNRSTVWRYINSANKAIIHESTYNPLTRSGMINVPFSDRSLPNPDPQMIRPEAEQYYSDIYI